MQYSLYNPTSTITHTIGNALANRSSTIEAEVQVKSRKKSCAVTCVSLYSFTATD